MRNFPLESQQPKFKPGDRVVVVSPGVHRQRSGLIMDVSRHAGDFVYRYKVRFADGAAGQFFGFELMPSENS